MSVSGALLVLLAAALPSELQARGAAPGDSHAPYGSPLWSTRQRGSLWLRAEAPAMISVPPSRFQMGSTPAEIVAAVADCAGEALGHRCSPELFADEAPLHEVALSGYWLDRREVSVAEYGRCVHARRCRPAPFAEGARRFDRPELPMTLVTWNDARRYCAFVGARLPTEAEFERAARGPARRTYPWGNSYHSALSNHGRFAWSATDDSDGFGELAPVGSFPDGRTPAGFLDLAGNAEEWVLDSYSPSHAPLPQRDPGLVSSADPASATPKVLRGGSYLSARPWLRGAARRAQRSDSRAPYIGFRCARSGHHRAPPVARRGAGR